MKLRLFFSAVLILAIILPGVFAVFYPRQVSANGAVIWNQAIVNGGVPSGLAIDSTGVYAGGRDDSLGADDGWRIEKRNLSTGASLWSLLENPSTGREGINDIAINSTNLYLVGNLDCDVPCLDTEWRMQKRDLAGNIIQTVTFNPNIQFNSAYEVVVDSSGVYVAGNQSSWMIIEKRDLSDLDNIIWSTSTGFASGLAVDGGGLYTIANNNLVVKLSLSGNFIWSTTSPSNLDDVVVDATGVYTVGGSGSFPNPSNVLIEKRSTTTGAVIWSRSDVFDRSYSGTSLIVDSTGVYAVGNDVSFLGSGPEAVIVKRRLSDGALLWFTTSTAMTGDHDFISTAVDGTGLYVGGYTPASGLDKNWVIEKHAKFTSTTLPTVSTNPASLVRGTKSTLNGSLNPQDSATPGWFRYSTANPGTCNDTFGIRSPAFDSTKSFGGGSILVGTGTSSVPFFQLITGLATTTTYYFCAIAENHNGKVLGSVLSFTTTDLPRGDLTSSIFDTQFGGGVVPNTISWKGFLPAGALVYFKIASATSSAPGSWNFIGPDGTAFTTYTPTGPDQPIRITGLNHLNHRYFRYKIYLESDVNENDSPRVDDVFFNLSP